MKEMSRLQRNRKRDIVAALFDKRTALEVAIDDANEKANTLVAELNLQLEALYESTVMPALTEWNAAVCDAQDFRSEIAEDLYNYYEDRSEKWQDSERGSEYAEWRDEWDDLEFCETPETELQYTPLSLEDLALTYVSEYAEMLEGLREDLTQ